jgi:tetratricopeptide (TPR) repeat protein
VKDEDEEGNEDDLPAEGYEWSFARQERELPPTEHRAHMHLLDEIEEEELESLDLSRAGDYILWAAAQAYEELGRDQAAIDILRRIAASTSPHPALYYPDILFRLEEALKDRGEYDEALSVLERTQRIEPALKDRCLERRAEILILRGEPDEGLRLFQKAGSAFPDDPWVPLRAAWALLTSGRYDAVRTWIERAERALRRVEDEEEARGAASEIERLRREEETRRGRRARGESKGAGPDGGPESEKEEILAALDAEEARLTSEPPRTSEGQARATKRLSDLHARASRAWDDAVEARNEALIAAFDELQWDVVGLAERFGLELPGVEDD